MSDKIADIEVAIDEGDMISGVNYVIAVLREDQLEKIAEAVVAKLRAMGETGK